ETLEALCKVKRAGLTRHIGVSNFEIADIKEAVWHASGALVCNPKTMNLFFYRPKITTTCRAHYIAVVAFCPLAPREGSNDAVLKRIGHTYGKSGAQVSLRWLVQQGISVIPRTSRIERLSENYSIFDFELSEAEMSEISSIARRRSRLATVMSPMRAFAL